MDTISAQSRDRLRQTIIDEIKSSEASIRALKSRRNTLAPISRLPFEILTTIFAILSELAWNERSVPLEWIRVAHVCRRWREAALDYPRFWSHIDFTKLTPAGLGEILARAKMAPLHLEADVGRWLFKPAEALGTQLEAHISHTRHLSISGNFETVLAQLLSSAPTLESLSLSRGSRSFYAIIPDNFFNRNAPKLTSLELEMCDISWNSPLFKGLRNLQIHDIPMDARPKLEDWLDALNEMPNLKTLSLQNAIPLAPPASPFITEPSRTITLPFLTRFNIHAHVKDCALALAHLRLPTLTWLHVNVKSYDREGEDVQLVIPHVARNVYVLQDIEPIRSILIAGERRCTEVYAWTMPDVDVEVCGPETLGDMSRSASFLFSARGDNWRYGVNTAIFDALLTLLPVNSVLTFTAHNLTELSKEFWLRHAPRWPLLEQARLVPTSIQAFREMLAEDTPPDGPRLPSLTRLILLDVTLCVLRTYHLYDMLIERVEQGVPLEVLDLCTCVVTDRAIRLLAEIVIDVQGPLDTRQGEMEEMEELFRVKPVGIGFWDGAEVVYDDGERGPWYGNVDDEVEDEREDEDEDEVEYDEPGDYSNELEYDDNYYF